MTIWKLKSATFLRTLAAGLCVSLTARASEVVVDDADGALGATRAPLTATVKLSRAERRAAAEGRLQLRVNPSTPSTSESAVPVQLFPPAQTGASARICWLMPPGQGGRRTFKLEETRRAPSPAIIVKEDSASGQLDITDVGKPVLRYNFTTVEPGDWITNVAPANRIYARARSDYIHPLFGLDGEPLTKDWSLDHPHHRGIYWAWPEVDWRGQRGDLHALQKVFAFPVGRCKTSGGPVFAQVEAENVWKWESGEPLVCERAVLRAYRVTGDDRLIDLEFQLTALNDPVWLARRGTDKYGGLNLRFAKVEDQQIVFHTDATNTVLRMAWGELSGRFSGAPTPSGVVVLQHNANPDYPGEWVEYANLNWLQPTFPAAGTRYELRKGQPLVLRFRLWLHRGSKAAPEDCAARWRAYHVPLAPTSLPVRQN